VSRVPLLLGFDLFGGHSDTLLVILLVAGPVLAAYGIFQLVSDLRSTPRKRIMDRLQGRKLTAMAATAVLDPNALRKRTQHEGGRLSQAFAQLSVTTRLQRVLEQANVPWSATRLLLNLTALACLLSAVLMLFNVGLIAAGGAAVAIYVLPIFYLIRRRQRRLNKFVLQLPEVFELLGQALRAGHSLASGMQLVAAEKPDPAGTEFGRVFHEQNLGLTVEEALTSLAERMDMLDVRFFVTSVLIQRQTGGDLAEVLDKIGSVIRDRVKLHGTVKALTAEGRLSGYVLLALPVIIFLAMLRINPDYAKVLLEHPQGQMALTTGIVMQLMGWAMIKKIVNIKV
jgi:tight adherence protein B